jgi:glycosyltransferase involved in cell wall biosynthesis
VRSQIERFYGLESTVVYPPIDTSKYYYNSPEDYWLSVNRISPAKRIREQILAFSDTEEKLIIAGSVDSVFEKYSEEIKSLIQENDNVELIGFVSDAELRDLYANSKGVIHIPQYEDFGIVPVEAMASGKPVIGSAEGGLLETIIDGRTGWLIDPTVEEIRKRISIPSESNYKEDCQSRSERFDKDRFERRMKEEIDTLSYN